MAKPTPRTLQVLHSRQLTPHMQRITFGGSEATAIQQDQESAYIKLVFPQDNGGRPLVRTYTIRQQRQNEFDVDFVLHQHAGPASQWAANAMPGDSMLIAGPGPKRMINPDADWFLLVGDMAALPAISINLSKLPENASGYAVIEVLGEADIQSLPHPKNVQLHWVIRSGGDGDALNAKVKLLPWLSGQPAVWAAGEFSGVLTLRRYFKQQQNVAKSRLYVSSYWQAGSTEDQHKVVKQQAVH